MLVTPIKHALFYIQGSIIMAILLASLSFILRENCTICNN